MFIFNIDVVRDIQANIGYLIVLPFITPALIFLEPFYLIILVFISRLLVNHRQIWYKKLFNATNAAIAIFISSAIFNYFFPVFDTNTLFNPIFFISEILLAFLYVLINNVFVFIAITLDKGKVDINAFIGLMSSTKSAFLTVFLGLFNTVAFYFTNFFGVAIITFLAYFVKPALQYRQVVDNELAVYTSFILHIIRQMDPITHSHSERVKFWTVLMAKRMGLPQNEIRQLSQAASWHDIGKIEVPYSILNKADKLTPEEYEIIKTHPEKGYNLVKDLHFFNKFQPVIRYHHERFDGTGYPSRVSGKEIPVHARIMAITDAFDAMTSDRSYRSAMSMSSAVAELRRNAGTQFDPDFVDFFIDALKAEYGEDFAGFNQKIIENVS